MAAPWRGRGGARPAKRAGIRSGGGGGGGDEENDDAPQTDNVHALTAGHRATEGKRRARMSKTLAVVFDAAARQYAAGESNRRLAKIAVQC